MTTPPKRHKLPELELDVNPSADDSHTDTSLIPSTHPRSASPMTSHAVANLSSVSRTGRGHGPGSSPHTQHIRRSLQSWVRSSNTHSDTNTGQANVNRGMGQASTIASHSMSPPGSAPRASIANETPPLSGIPPATSRPVATTAQDLGQRVQLIPCLAYSLPSPGSGIAIPQLVGTMTGKPINNRVMAQHTINVQQPPGTPRNDQPLSRSDRFLHLPSLQTQGLEASGTTNGLEGLPAHQTSGLTDCNPLEPYLSDDMVHTVEKGNKITLMKVTPEEESHDYERVKVEDFEWMCFEIHCFEDAQNSEITWYTELHPVYRGYENEDSQDSPLKETHIRIVKVGFKKDPDRSHWIQWQTNALKDVVKTAHLGLKYFTDVYEQDYVFFKAFPCYGKIPRQYFAQLAEASEETKKHQAIEFSNQSGQNRKSPTQYQNPAQSTSQNGIHTLLAKRAFGDIYQQMSPTEHTERPASAQGLHDTPATQTGETASSNALLERPSLEGNKIKVVKVSSKQTWSPSDGFQYILTNELIMSRRFELRYFTDAKDPHWSFYFKEVRPFYTGNVKSKTTFKAWASGLRIQLVKIDTQENPDPKFWKHWPSAALDAVVKHTNLDFEWCEGCRFPDRTAFKCSTHLLADTIAHSQKSLSFESATEEQVVSTQIMKSSRPQSQQPPVAGFSLDGHAFPPLVNNPKPKKSKKLKAANLRDSSSKPFEENSKQKKPTKPEKFVPRREFTPPDEVPLWENDKKGFTQQKIHWSLDGPEYHSWAHGWNAYEKFRAYCRSSFCPPIIGIMLNTLELDDVEGAQKLIENALPPVAKFDLDRVFQESEELRLRKVSDFNRNWHRKIRIIRAKEAEDKEKKEKGDDYNDVPDATTAMIDLTKEVSEEESHIPEESSSSSNSIKQRSQFLQGGTTDTPSAEELKTSPTQETEAASFQPLNAPRKERQHESDSETERTPVKRQRRRMWGNGA